MKCRQCGKELEKKNKTCPHCGYVNSVENLLKKVEIPKELHHLSTKQLQNHLNRQRFFSKTWYIILGVVVVVSLAVFSIHYFKNTKQASLVPNFHDDLIENTSSNAMGNSVANIVNGGLLLQYGNDIYASDSSGLSKISLTLDKKETILSDSVCYLNMDEDGLYYINNKDSMIYHYDLNTKSITSLNIQASQLMSVGNYLYYLENNSNRAIYQVNKDTLETKKMTQSTCVQFKIIGDWLYYTTDSAIYQMPVLGGEIMKLADEPYSHFVVDNQTIYYIDKVTGYIWQVKKDGSNKSVVVQNKCTCFLLTERYLYYAKEEGGLIKLNRENGEVSLITKEKANRLHMAGTWLYYLTTTGEGRFVSIDENSEMVTPVDVITESE